MKHCRKMLLIFALLAVVLPVLLISAFADGNAVLVWHADADESVQVAVQNNGTGYLFLPSSADYAALRLSAPVDTVLASADSSVTVSLPANQTVSVDLTSIFGEMKEGESYSLFVRSSAGSSNITVMKSANLSSMHITIEGDLQAVNQSEDKSVSFPGTYFVLDPSGSVTSCGTLDQFKGRGNSSWERSGGKQPYNIKLTYSSELIPGSGKSKRWALVSENVSKHDLTGLSNKTAMQLYRDLGGEYALDSENIDLYVNNEYRGMYMLSEKVTFSKGVIDIPDTVYTNEDKQNQVMVIRPGGVVEEPKNWNLVPRKGDDLSITELESASEDYAIAAGIQAYKYCRDSEIASQSGYLLEIDFRFYGESAWFVTRRGIAMNICEPEHPGREEVQRIAAYVQRFEDALFSPDGFNSEGEYYADLLDLGSQAQMVLLDSYLCNRDAHRASTYYYTTLDADGNPGILKAGPAWDYNSVDMSAIHYYGNDIGGYAYYIIWMTQLATHGDFMYQLDAMNTELLLPAADALLNGGFQAYIDELAASQKMNELLWRNNFQLNARQYLESLTSRDNVWRNSLWTQDKLLGLCLTRDGDTLKVQTAGTAENLAWYRYDEASASYQAVSGASGTEYTPDEKGIYAVSASGKNIIYNARSASFADQYSPNGRPSPTIFDSVTVYSNPVDTSRTEEPEPVPEAEAEPEQQKPADSQPFTAEESALPVSEPVAPAAPENAPVEEQTGDEARLTVICALGVGTAVLLLISLFKPKKKTK